MIEYLIDGPLWYFSLAVFCIGVAWQLGSITFASRKPDLSVARAPAIPAAVKSVFSRFLPHKEIISQITIPLVAGYMFHLGLFALLFFAAPHVESVNRLALVAHRDDLEQVVRSFTQ